MHRILAIVLAFVMFPSLASADTWPSFDAPPAVERVGTSDVAVLIGVEDYLFVPDVRGARQNIADWERFLRDGLGVPTVKTLINEQATREEMLAAAEAAAALAGAESTVWFVFVGHGVPTSDGLDGRLLGVDAQQTSRSVEARGVSRSELLTRLEVGQQNRTVVLFDACFSGQLPSGEALVPGAQPVVAVNAPTVDERTVLMSAAASNEVAGSLPGLGRPAFSYLILGGMRGWADRSGDAAVTAEEAVVFAKRELLAVPGRRQTPELVGLSQAVLSQNATEPRPTSVVVEVPRPREEEARIATVDPTARQPIDLRGRSRLFGTVGAGAGGEVTYETGAFLLHFATGIRLSNPDSTTRIGLTSAIGYANVTNVIAEESEAMLRSALAQLDASELTPDLSSTTHLGTFSVGPVIEVGRGDVRFFGDLRGGLALPIGGECVAWDFESDDDPPCSEREGKASPMFGARLGVGYRLFEVAAQSSFTTRNYELDDGNGGKVDVGNDLFVAGLTAGIGFDL